MAEDKISSIIDRGAIEGEVKFLEGKIQEAIAAIQAAKKQSIAFNVDTKSMADYNKNVKALDAALKAAQKSTDDLAKANLSQAKAATEASKANLNDAKASTEASKAKVNEAKATKEAAAAKALEQKITQNAIREKEKLEKQLQREQKALDDLDDEYKILSKAYDDAAAKAKRLAAAFGVNHPAAAQAIDDAQKLDKALKDIDAAVGQHRRNVGNYASATFSLTQVLREAPAFANSFATGISAIGNNLPILIDEFKKVKDQVGSTGQAFRIFASSMFTLTGILPIALLAVQLFAKEITGFFASLTAGGRAMIAFNKQLEDFQYESKRAAESLEAFRKQMEFLKEIEQINLDINFTGNFEKTLISLREDSIDLTNLIGEIDANIEAATKRRSQIQESVISQLTSTGREVSAAYGTFASIPAAALEKLSESEKKRFEAAKNAEEEVTKLQLDREKTVNDQRIIYRRIELAKIEEQRRKNKELADSILDQLRREREAAFELWKYKQELLIAEQKARVAVYDGPSQVKAREKQFSLEQQLLNRQAEYELSLADELAGDLASVRAKGLISEEDYRAQLLKIERLTASERALIQTKLYEDSRNLRFEELNDIKLFAQIALQELLATANAQSDALAAVARDQSEKEAQARQQALDTRLKGMEGDQVRVRRAWEVETQDRLRSLAEQYRKGLISTRQYQDAKYAIEANAREQAIRADIEYYESILKLATTTTLPEDIQKKAIEELHKLKLQLGAEDVQNTEKTEAEKAAIRQKYAEAGKAALLVFTQFFTDSIDREKNAVQDQIDLLEAQRLKDIEVERSKQQTAAERADAIAVIDARASAQRQQLELKQRQLDQQKARWEKANAIAQIIQNTARAVAEALPNVPLSILVGAIGAAQLVRAIAAPIPRYAEGTDNHPGGLAWIGDGGRSEGVRLPDGTLYKSAATPQLVNLPPGTQVYPDFNRMAVTAPVKQIDTTATLKQVGRDIVRAVKSQPQPILTSEGNWKRSMKQGSTFRTYLNKNL
jgi:hypothetical protein